MASSQTWTSAPRIPIDEDVSWQHKPDPDKPTSTDPADWFWRRDRRVTFKAEVSQAGRYGADFQAYCDSASITDPVLRYFDGPASSIADLMQDAQAKGVTFASLAHKLGGKKVSMMEPGPGVPQPTSGWSRGKGERQVALCSHLNSRKLAKSR